MEARAICIFFHQLLEYVPHCAHLETLRLHRPFHLTSQQSYLSPRHPIARPLQQHLPSDNLSSKNLTGSV